MAAKYTYQINFGSGYVDTELFNCQLSLVNRRNESFLGIIDTYLEGSFDLLGDDFDSALVGFSAYGYITLDVYLGISTIASTFCYDLCDLDYNEKKCTIKNFKKFESNSVRYYWDRTFVFEGTDDLFETVGVKMTDYAEPLIGVIDAATISLGILEDFDPTDYWYSTGIDIDLDDLRIAAMRDMLNAGSTAVLGGQRKSLTLKKLFGLICELFNITITIDGAHIYFKKHTDFIDNSLDLSTELVNKKVRNYDLSKLYKAEIFKFSDNNSIDDDVDNTNCELTYNYAGDILEHDLQEFTTLWNFSDELSSDGWFIGIVDPLTEILVSENGYVSSSSKPNAHLFPANLLDTYYRDWINTDKKYFSVCGTPSAAAPDYFKNFIEISEIDYTLADPSVFYDSIILETVALTQRIGLVMEQKTDLNTNITKFISYEFYNDIDV